MRPEPYHWDEMKIGPGAPPIKTAQGWLSIYHGVFDTMDGSVYRLGVALHDLDDPAGSSASATAGFCNPKTPGKSSATSTTSSSPAAPSPNPTAP